jgi:predicted MFS family arabinose efflux permease
MSRDHGWTREVFSFAIALQNLVYGAVSPLAGRLADRRGAGKVILGSSVVYAIGLLLMSVAATGTALALSAGLLVGAGLGGTTTAVVFGAIARAVPPARRSLAMGIAMSVGSFGQFLLLPSALKAIDAFGWATSLVALAAVAALVAPLSFALFERIEPPAVAEPSAHLGEVLSEAFSTRGFWLLSLGFFVCGFHVTFIGTHLPAYLTDRGLDAGVGAMVLALVGLFNIAGSYLSGLLGGRMSKPGLLVGIYLLRAVVISLFFFLPLSELSAYLFGAAMGLLWLSTVPPTNGTVATMFGVRNMAMLGGLVFFFHQLGSFLGGWLGGRLYVATGRYDTVWWLSIGLALLAALLNVPIREVPVARLAAAPEGAR